MISTDLQIDFLQYVKNSATNEIINYYSNFLTVVHIAHNGKNGDTHRSSNFLNFGT